MGSLEFNRCTISKASQTLFTYGQGYVESLFKQINPRLHAFILPIKNANDNELHFLYVTNGYRGGFMFRFL